MTMTLAGLVFLEHSHMLAHLILTQPYRDIGILIIKIGKLRSGRLGTFRKPLVAGGSQDGDQGVWDTHLLLSTVWVPRGGQSILKN